MEDSINILLVDDHQMFLDGLEMLLDSYPSETTVRQALGGLEAQKKIVEEKPNLVISDISMPDLNGLELTKWVKTEHPEVKVLIISMYNDGPMVTDIFQAEAEGYILKNTGKKELFYAINSILKGSTHYSGTVLEQLSLQKNRNQEREWFQSLTKRETEILKLILEELTTEQIGEKLFISGRTVETHRKHIMEKSGTKTVVGLMKSIAPMITSGELEA